jgi:hypothetical protein
MDRAINEFPFYVWRILFDGSLRYLWAGLAILIGVGGLTQETPKGTAEFTLSIPVSRRHLAWSQMALPCLQLTILALLPAIVIPALSHFVGGSYGIGEAICRGLLMAGGGLVIFSFTSLLSALSESPYVPMLVSAATVIILESVVGPYQNDLKEPLLFRAVDLFRLISGPPDLQWRSFPRVGLLVSGTLALILGLATIRVIENRDYW